MTEKLSSLTKKELSARFILAKESLKDLRKETDAKTSGTNDRGFTRHLQNTMRKLKKASRTQDKKKKKMYFREKKRKKRAKWRIFRIVKRGLARITNPKEAEEFKEKYKDVLDLEVIYTPFEQEVISGLKNQRVIRRKSFKHIAYYKRKKFSKFMRRGDRWDFQYLNRIREINLSASVPAHAKEVFVTRKTFKYFYGTLKNNNLKKVYKYAKFKRAKILNFSYFLESRLCVIICRLGFVRNVSQSKHIIRQGGVYVNKKLIKFPDFKVKVGDFIQIDEESFLRSFHENIYVLTQEQINEVYDKNFTELPHLYVKQRMLLGTVLYNPTNINQLLFEQKPNLFFGGDKVDFDVTVQTAKISRSKYRFNRFTEKKAREGITERQKGPFVKYHNNTTKAAISLIPVERVINVCSYFLRH